MIIFLVTLALVAMICYSLFINKVKGLPPGPPPLPLLGNVLQFDVDMDKKFIEWRKKYGKAFTIWMPHPTVVITDHTLLQEHIVKDGDKFSDRINPKMLMKYLVGGEYGLVFNDNDMQMEYQTSQEQRRFALHALRNVGFNNATIQNTDVDYSQEIIAKQHGANKQPVDPTLGIMIVVANIIWQQTFGRTLPYDDPLSPRVLELVKQFVVLSTHPAIVCLEFIPPIRHFDKVFGSPIQTLVDANEGILEVLKKEIEIVHKEFNEDDPPKCLAEAFIAEMKRRETKGEEMGTFTEHQLLIACYDVWTAGFETTVTTLRFILHHMINYPGVQKKAQAEIDEKIGKRNIQMEDQKILPYCNAVIQETQRLANIVAINFTRIVNAPVNIEGYDIPVGTGVIPEFSIVHMDENEFERPDYFCPERHIDQNGELVKDPRITPFSLGKRSCLGEGLARMELFLYFTSFIQHLTFSSVTKVPPALNVQIGFTRSPAPYKVLIEGR